MVLEQYFGCECTCLNHIAHFGYYPPENGEKIAEDEYEEDNFIFLTVKTGNYLRRISPPVFTNPRYWGWEFRSYIYHNFFKRVPIVFGYLFNKRYIKKDGILDCFEFQNKDLLLMKEFLSHLTDEEIEFNKKDLSDYNYYVNKLNAYMGQYIIDLDNERWRLRLTVERIDESFPYSLGWEIQFLSRKIFGRIKYALKYLF